jgi:hypothetical protein
LMPRRGAEGSLDQDAVVAVFAANLRLAIEKKRERVERLLGAPLDAVDAALRVKIEASGKLLGGKKEQKLTKKMLVRLFKEVVAEGAPTPQAAVPTPIATPKDMAEPEPQPEPPSSSLPPVPLPGSAGATAASTTYCEPRAAESALEALEPAQRAFVLFREIIGVEHMEQEEEEEEGDEEEGDGDEDGGEPEPIAKLTTIDGGGGNRAGGAAIQVPSAAAAAASGAPPPLTDDELALAELVNLNSAGGGGGPKKRKKKAGGGKKGGGGGGGGGWSWRKDLTSLYSVIGGLEKLERERPSTGFFGACGAPAADRGYGARVDISYAWARGGVPGARPRLLSCMTIRLHGRGVTINRCPPALHHHAGCECVRAAVLLRLTMSSWAGHRGGTITRAGNGDVVEGMRSVSDTHDPDGPGCRIRLFMGKTKPKGAMPGYIKLSKADDEAAVEAQWRALQDRFSQPRTMLIYHLTNHYALVFALRSWVEPATSEVRRQLLTTRRGQRPSVWIEWDEVRATILKWVGYKLLVVQRLGSAGPS